MKTRGTSITHTYLVVGPQARLLPLRGGELVRHVVPHAQGARVAAAEVVLPAGQGVGGSHFPLPAPMLVSAAAEAVRHVHLREFGGGGGGLEGIRIRLEFAWGQRGRSERAWERRRRSARVHTWRVRMWC